MRPSYLGKILLRWCDSCHVPVLSEMCSRCGSLTREVPVTPPGDARPAFPYDVALVNAIYERHFGVPLVPSGHLCLLNKVPDRDRMEEIVIGGGIAGSIRYIPDERRWEPIPRPEAGSLIRPSEHVVVVDDGAVAPIREKGAGVLAPGVVAIADGIQKGDEVLLLDRNGACIGAGRAKVSTGEAKALKKGVVVRTRRNVPSRIVPGAATWDDAVNANRGELDRKEAAAIAFVREVIKRNPFPANISYSGGKDSLASLIVVTKGAGTLPLLFADTGMEFPETYQNVQTVKDHYCLDVVRTGRPEAFWEQFEHQGPPAVNARWCCRTCKLEPVTNLIRARWGECISFIGQRKYESQRRARSLRVWRNPNVQGQVCAAPIHNWTALHVWLYLMREDAPFNVLYGRGLDRIGCFMCPASDMALIHRIEDEYPSLWHEWSARLKCYEVSHKLPAGWADAGRWRVRDVEKNEDDSDC